MFYVTKWQISIPKKKKRTSHQHKDL